MKLSSAISFLFVGTASAFAPSPVSYSKTSSSSVREVVADALAVHNRPRIMFEYAAVVKTCDRG